ncbi:MAG: CotH kinase family protein [Defluviitaleaceae bacterium]|nr:CotH kinase family protein [Defluviitaleaceae bacterium]MCL2275617.1 CotH kinase family protein [Defluviitaleaceae bacterium]
MRKNIVFACILLILIAVVAVWHGLSALGAGQGSSSRGGQAEAPILPAPSVTELAETPSQAYTPLADIAPVVSDDLVLTFSEGGHFFNEGVYLEIFASREGARVHYTLDGSIPTSDSYLYEEAMYIRAGRGVRVVVVRAVAFYENYVSRVFTHSFFVGETIDERFGLDMLIFSVASCPHGLFDHYEGILVEGYLREEFIRENPRHRVVPTDPANFNWRGREGERPASVEVFHPDGTRVLVQDAGVRAHGAWSRAYDQMSLRLIARREYSPHTGTFRYPFFRDDPVLDGSGNMIDRYDRIILRNGGNDRNFGMLRNEVGSVLSRELGLPVVTPVRGASVFLNGEFWGFAWLNVQIQEHYLQSLFNSPTREFDIVHQGERWIQTDCYDLRDAILFKNSFAEKDLTDDAVFAQLNEILDVEHKLRYYAFTIFIGNEDWPHNNLRRFRYTGEFAEGMPQELDGRWRYIGNDLDMTMGLYGTGPNVPTFRRVLLDDNNAGQLLRAILQRPDKQAYFTAVMDEIINHITPQRMTDLIAELYMQVFHEIGHGLMAGRYNHWVSPWSIIDNHQNMIAFAEGRGANMRDGLRRLFG